MRLARTRRAVEQHPALEVLAAGHQPAAMASDAHDLKGRPPVLASARDEMAKLAGETAAKAMVDDNPRAIISGAPIPYIPAMA